MALIGQGLFLALLTEARQNTIKPVANSGIRYAQNPLDLFDVASREQEHLDKLVLLTRQVIEWGPSEAPFNDCTARITFEPPNVHVTAAGRATLNGTSWQTRHLRGVNDVNAMLDIIDDST